MPRVCSYTGPWACVLGVKPNSAGPQRKVEQVQGGEGGLRGRRM